jgi:hypothetical protein
MGVVRGGPQLVEKKTPLFFLLKSGVQFRFRANTIEVVVLLLLILPTTALTSMTPPPVPVRRAAFLPTSLTDVAFFLQRDDSIAVAPVMNPGAPTRTHS